MVKNYLEAVGIMTALKGGVCVESVLRPLKRTVVSGERVKGASAGKCVEA